jgi:hypothetical protein
MDISRFSKKLDMMEKRINKEVQDEIKNAVFDMQTMLLESKSMGGTPVITGFLRNNWFVSMGSPDPTTTGSKENPGTALSKQNSKMDAFITANILVYNSIYLNNSVEYGEEVNNGVGGGAGQRFRETAIDRGRISISQAKVIK